MGTIADKLSYLNDTKTSIKNAIASRGVTVSDNDTFRDYASKITEIGETVEKTKFGMSIDSLIGDVDENGVLKRTTWTGILNFAGVKEIGYRALYYEFYSHAGITSVDLSSLQSVGYQGMYYAFYDCTGITSVDLSSLQSIGGEGMYYVFCNCKGITDVDLSSLQSVGSYGMYYAFYFCTRLTSVDLNSLITIDSNGLHSTFKYCDRITKISFPALTDVQANSFGASAAQGAFAYCTGLTEIHFRADMQVTIEAMTGYADKWGATNATIYFDL